MRHILLKIPGQVYLWLGVLIFGASSSITRKLTQLGAAQFVNGHNPISLCNVLFVGNLCALGVMVALYRHHLTGHNFKKITRSEWVSLTIVALFSGALGPAAVFQALALSPVNNIILLGRLELPLVLIASSLILKERLTRNQKFGAIVILFGIAITVLGNPSSGSDLMFNLGTGEFLTIASAILFSISSIVNKQNLSHIPIGIVSSFRTGLGSIIFFCVAIQLYGSEHFTEMFSPFLWQWMLVYGTIIVVVGQFFWTKGFRETPVSVSAIVSCFSPIVGMVFAYWILAEAPTTAQLIGSVVLLLGLLLSQTKHQINPAPEILI